MRVLDANFLIDYLGGVPAAERYYEDNGGADQLRVIPASAHAETLVGVGNHPNGDVERATEALGWDEVYEVDEVLSTEAARIADEVGPQGPYLDGSLRRSLSTTTLPGGRRRVQSVVARNRMRRFQSVTAAPSSVSPSGTPRE